MRSICLQPIVLIGLTFAAVGLPHVPNSVRALALLGLLFDAICGILLHIYVMHSDLSVSLEGSHLEINSTFDIGMTAVRGGIMKFKYQVTFLGDHLGAVAGGFIELAVTLGAIAMCIGLWLLATRSRARHIA